MPTAAARAPEYRYRNVAPTWASAYLWPAVRRILEGHRLAGGRAFDLGCGNGATANMLCELGFEVTGVDTSASGIALASRHFPHARFEVASAYDDLHAHFGAFPLVVSLEVIEHCFDPRRFARTVLSLIEPGGIGIVSTPYHGYWKNLALALAGAWDAHLDPLWDGGHIKFFSPASLTALLREAGFAEVRLVRIGRVPPLAKSMIAVVRK